MGFNKETLIKCFGLLLVILVILVIFVKLDQKGFFDKAKSKEKKTNKRNKNKSKKGKETLEDDDSDDDSDEPAQSKPQSKSNWDLMKTIHHLNKIQDHNISQLVQ